MRTVVAMKTCLTFIFFLLAGIFNFAGPVGAQIAAFEHIVIVVQENRTPDSLFYALCATVVCNTNPAPGQYDIQTQNWLDKDSKTGVVQPTAVNLANKYDIYHRHIDFLTMCDLGQTKTQCAMDGAGGIPCKSQICPKNPNFRYVDNSSGTIQPYLDLATQYGWANYMFQTNQGPSFPAHQFLFGATSAPSAEDDHKGTFAAENLLIYKKNGCIARPEATVQLINAKGVENPANQIYPCFEHETISDLLDAQGQSWRYYTPGAGSLWSAPDAIDHICQPVSGNCTGSSWTQNVDLVPNDVLSDVAACNLRSVSWVIPTAQNSDHAKSNTGGGPSWVASIVNAIGNSPCLNKDGTSYWNSTAIIVTWDDWGGWYDHEAPTFLPYPQGGYQDGFRVPMLFVSAYTTAGLVNDSRLDFGAIARFVESNFGIPEGELTFSDSRSDHNLKSFYNLSLTPRPFQTINAPKKAADFLKDKSPLLPPDDD